MCPKNKANSSEPLRNPKKKIAENSKNLSTKSALFWRNTKLFFSLSTLPNGPLQHHSAHSHTHTHTPCYSLFFLLLFFFNNSSKNVEIADRTSRARLTNRRSCSRDVVSKFGRPGKSRPSNTGRKARRRDVRMPRHCAAFAVFG